MPGVRVPSLSRSDLRDVERVERFARFLGVDERVLRREIREGRVPGGERMGRNYVIYTWLYFDALAAAAMKRRPQ